MTELRWIKVVMTFDVATHNWRSVRYEHVETWHSMVANEVPGVATEVALFSTTVALAKDAQLIKQVERLLACIRSLIVQLNCSPFVANNQLNTC
ncbi:uncharacterized protein CLUP02_15712 [Colletotrichum lupini]|uniref:Uncharacterized protein n=1 Tax=Colletotrichum lupini TaxID=145971 RepID=A0A9Q8T8I5_9PEZI|nr:uncharacterized protein CLUP02_15712 [Colletotrichum lupini]KAK1714411.1 hypothetical protein BDP67DRAFT_514028 [Colletotrichum lupini]UQC90182.1 hypothetical protein CLUP02_15712 [Colletotrichum lupini]